MCDMSFKFDGCTGRGSDISTASASPAQSDEKFGEPASAQETNSQRLTEHDLPPVRNTFIDYPAVAQAQRCRTVSAPNCLDADGSSLLASAEPASPGSVDPPQASPASTGAPSGGEGPAGSTQSSSAASSPEKPRASPASADGVEGQDDDGANSGAEADGDHGQHGSDDAHSAAGSDGVEGSAEADADQGQQGLDGAHSGGAEADGDHGQQDLDSGDFRAQFESVVDEIRSLKEKLKGDGLSGNEHPQIKVLVEKLSGLKRFIVRVGDVA